MWCHPRNLQKHLPHHIIKYDNGLHQTSIHSAVMELMTDEIRWSTYCTEWRQAQAEGLKGIPLAGICSLSILSSLPFPVSLCLSSSFFPPSSHHSKMLPGPVLVAMVTKTGGILTWPYLPGRWLVWRMKAWKEGQGKGGDVTRPPAPEWEGSSLRPPASAHRHNGCLFKAGLSWGGAAGWFYLTDWLIDRTSGLLIWDVRLGSGPAVLPLSSAMLLLPLKCTPNCQDAEITQVL